MPRLPFATPRLPSVAPWIVAFGASTLHTSERPSTTAQWTTLGRALELDRPGDERIVNDPYAPLFLTGMTRRLLRATTPAHAVLRRLEKSAPGAVSTSALCRHRFIDEKLLEALPDVAQVVLLGAGYDSRAYRLAAAIGARPLFEVDLAPLSRAKAAIVEAHPDCFADVGVRRVELDFRTQSLAERLTAAGLAADRPAFVVWEGVSMYLTRVAVTDTLDALAQVCGSGTVVAMDAWRRVPGSSPGAQARRAGERAVGLIGEPIEFHVQPGGLADMLNATGFGIVDIATAAEMTARFSTDGRVCDEGMYVVAGRLR